MKRFRNSGGKGGGGKKKKKGFTHVYFAVAVAHKRGVVVVKL